jgi:HD-GYP domain-containing protein (c-di-GMP phosphodiesterase class II)
MNKICSLDFLNKEEFDSDVLSAGGKILFSKGDKIKPEILLSLYFKEIIVKEPIQIPKEVQTEKEKVQKTIIVSEDTDEEIQEPEEDQLDISLYDKMTLQELLLNRPTENLDFDKEHAYKIAQLSYNLGEAMGMPIKNLKELKDAAYYYRIGRIRLTQEDLSDVDFRAKQAVIGYDLLVLEMKMPKKIAEVTKMYLKDYHSAEFDFNPNKPSDIPYAHIVSIVDYYDRLINEDSVSKEDALGRMSTLGENRFNIFALEKFIDMMRNSDD